MALRRGVSTWVFGLLPTSYGGGSSMKGLGLRLELEWVNSRSLDILEHGPLSKPLFLIRRDSSLEGESLC